MVIRNEASFLIVPFPFYAISLRSSTLEHHWERPKKKVSSKNLVKVLPISKIPLTVIIYLFLFKILYSRLVLKEEPEVKASKLGNDDRQSKSSQEKDDRKELLKHLPYLKVI